MHVMLSNQPQTNKNSNLAAQTLSRANKHKKKRGMKFSLVIGYKGNKSTPFSLPSGSGSFPSCCTSMMELGLFIPARSKSQKDVFCYFK